MITYSITDSAGVIVRSGSMLSDADLVHIVLGAGESMAQGVTGRPGLDKIIAGVVVPVVATPTLAERKAAALDRLAERRWQIEVGGIAVAGVIVATDDRSKLLITQAAARAEADPDFTTPWKGVDGWHTLTAAGITAVRDAVFAHVATCFAREAELAAAIEAADVGGLAAIEAAALTFWP